MDTTKAIACIKRALTLASNIYVRGEEAKIMAMALQSMENALKILEEQPEEEVNDGR